VQHRVGLLGLVFRWLLRFEIAHHHEHHVGVVNSVFFAVLSSLATCFTASSVVGDHEFA
jgi:hypothetical protein